MDKAERIEVNGFTWYWQEVSNADGKLLAINLFDANGEFVTEFSDYKEMVYFLSSVIECGEGAVICGTSQR